jgi:hypothetical protein
METIKTTQRINDQYGVSSKTLKVRLGAWVKVSEGVSVNIQ